MAIQHPALRRIFPSSRLWRAALCWVLMLAGLTGGCKRNQNESATSPVSEPESKPASKPDSPSAESGYFKTPFQDESQYIVGAIAADVAEMVYFAKNNQLPDANLFSVQAVEKPDSPLRAPVYFVKIGFGKKEPLQLEVNVDGPIWSAAVYLNMTAALANEAGLQSSLQSHSEDTALLKRLTDGLAATVEQENQKLSASLQSDFSNPVLHEQAAVLLGAFSLRETSGIFYDIRGRCQSSLLTLFGPVSVLTIDTFCEFVSIVRTDTCIDTCMGRKRIPAYSYTVVGLCDGARASPRQKHRSCCFGSPNTSTPRHDHPRT
jgi:hypothetical protein